MHNRSSRVLSFEEQSVLALGTKFVPTPKPLETLRIKAAFSDLFRKIKLKTFFKEANDNPDFNPKWWLPNQSSFCPDLAELPYPIALAISRL